MSPLPRCHGRRGDRKAWSVKPCTARTDPRPLCGWRTGWAS